MSETLEPIHTHAYTHSGKFGGSKAGRPLAFGVVVDEYERELKLQGVRVRNAGSKSPYITIERAGECIRAAVNPDDENLRRIILEALSLD